MSDSALYQQIADRLVRAGYDPTKAGDAINWLIKALHPAWGGTCTTIPDHALVPAVCPDYVVSTTIGAPAGTAVGDDWDCLIFKPPGDCTGAVIVRGPAGTVFDTAHLGNGVTASSVTVDILRVQPMSQFELPTNFFPYDNFSPSTPLVGGTTYTPLPALRPVGARQRYAGITVYPVSSDLYNQGTIFAGQFARLSRNGFGSARSGLVSDIPGMGAYPNDWEVFRRVFADVPFDETSMQMLDPAAVAWPYKNGAYCPIRFLDPTIDFQQPAHTEPAMLATQYQSGGTHQAAGCVTVPQTIGTQFVKQTVGTERPPPWMYDQGLVAGNAAYDAFESVTLPVTIPVIILRGLASQASITVRAYQGLEYMAGIDSPALAFTKAPSPPAPNIIALYHQILHDMNRSVWPSSYNSLGTILSAILNVAKTVLPVVGGAISLVPHPIAQGIGLGARLLGAGAGAASAALDGRGMTPVPVPVKAAPLSGGPARTVPAIKPRPKPARRPVRKLPPTTSARRRRR